MTLIQSEAHGNKPLKLPWASCAQNAGERQVIYRMGNTGPVSAFPEKSGNASRPEVKPKSAMLHSLILPGWGQLDNGSKKKAALFIAAELFFIGGYIYENRQAKQENLTVNERFAYRTDRNSFVIYFIVAKILSITDAYVDAQLREFNVSDVTPDELKRKDPEEEEEE